MTALRSPFLRLEQLVDHVSLAKLFSRARGGESRNDVEYGKEFSAVSVVGMLHAQYSGEIGIVPLGCGFLLLSNIQIASREL